MRMLLAAMLLMSVIGCTSLHPMDITMVDNPTYQQTIDIAELNKQAIFDKSKQWLALTFVSAKKVIEYENISEGLIIGNGATTVPYIIESVVTGPITYNTPITFTMIEDIKDGKVRMTFRNIKTSDGTMYQDAWQKLQPKLEILCADLKAFLTVKNTW